MSSARWLSACTRLDSPNFGDRPKNIEIDLIVIHSISLPPGIYGKNYIQDFFLNKLDHGIHPYFEDIKGLEVSAHFLIDRLGHTTQFVSCLNRAWHAGLSVYDGRDNCNDFSLGVELEGLEGDSFTAVQYEALAHLCSLLMDTFPSIQRERIVAHSDISPGRKSDPGAGFDWSHFLACLDFAHKDK